jgi:DNA-binding GntR family transcriptional regulator
LTDVKPRAYSCGAVTASGTRRDVTTWRERHDAAVEDHHQALTAVQQAAEKRAQALLDGVAELGSQAAVARELGVTRASVNQAIKALEKKKPGDKPV